ncbi:Hsp20/alpha crystallin family protein [Symbiobacterium thermophilum]|uniref:Hsp20/alpha crystallin family protein n=1 Tax=Symbiobacterium thermophilum TaxID=2734 RepID=UPI0035C6BDB6
MDLIPWNPLRELERIRTPLERFFADPFLGPMMPFSGGMGAFPVEVAEQGDDIVVRCELAGIDPQDVDVRITDQGVTIRGERKAEEVDRQRGTYRSERFYGAFSRTVSFPVPVDSERAQATFRHGLLEVRAPKRNPDAGPDGRRLNITPLQ